MLGIISREFPSLRIPCDIALEESVGRITARPLFATYSVPEAVLSAMDGIAVRSEDTWGASEQRPVTLTNNARVNTGNLIPPGFDAVIMIEDVTFEGNRAVIRKAAGPWQHVRPAGEDIAESEMILPSAHRIRPHEIGALAAYGISRVPVLTARVGLVPTGSELVTPGTRPAPGQVVESNTVMASAWLRSIGAECRKYPVTPDDPDLISERIEQAVAENDIVIISAGSSAGTRDYTAEVVSRLGEILVHGIAIKPGKPAIIGKINRKPVIGMPGYPLSAMTVIREIMVPLLGRYGLSAPDPVTLTATLATSLHSETGTCEYVLLAIGKIRNRFIAIPLSRGSGVQMSGVRAQAFLRIPADSEGYEAGEEVPVTLMVPEEIAERTLLISGSHDPVLDCLLELMQKEGVTLHSSHTGSTGGILALKRGSCHAAPMHLLHPSGEYNLPFLRHYLPGEDITLVGIAGREQGIVSREGLSLADLPSHTFINRQKGSGTRMLLDYELDRQGIAPGSIRGYDRELTTHIGVALAVRQGEADAGMCVYSAARVLGLPFVPVGRERYELAIRTGDLADPRIKTLLGAINSERFREILQHLGGYDISCTGQLRNTLR
ncbi:MAG: molybdopterin biosynthesis protein [Methanoregulaceae archaeon]|nr:molybdopterin biosynthesis protein [Methanoregulaceae archaeon]